MLVNIALIFLGFVGMELCSIVIHKYIMHGPLWIIHKTHHRPKSGFFELNDGFSAFFALCGLILLFIGMPNFTPLFYLGCGISIYGILYFIIHDILVHRRVRVKWQPLGKYLKALRYAHQMHHKHTNKTPSESYGLFLISKKYFKD